MLHKATKRLLSINGVSREIDDTYQGKISLLAQDPTRSDPSAIHLELTYDDVQNNSKDGRPYLIGNFALTSPELRGIQITSDCSLVGEQQLNSTSLRLGASPLITIDTSVTTNKGAEIVLPDPNAVTYDVSSYDQYLDSADINGYLESIAEALGIDPEHLNSLID
jgi:hypothetical protein